MGKRAMRLKRLTGLVALIVGLGLYALLVMKFAVTYLPRHPVAEVIFYPIAGILWVFPAIPLVRWLRDGPKDK